jgi:hypothetical protein
MAPGCGAAVHRRLDFWLGDWNVSDAAGRLLGTNRITAVEGGCAVEERWRSASGHTGRSLFYVDRSSGLWRQVWITDQGPMKEKVERPGAVPGALRFAGIVATWRGPALDRTTLTVLPDGRVRQRIEQSLDQGRSWERWEGLYSRMPGSCDGPEHRRFDFWLGDWAVTVRSRVDPGSEKWLLARGSSRIRSILNGCVIEERFTAEDHQHRSWSGRSHSTWVPSRRQWRQTWVDDSGSYLVFTGGWDDGRMVLVGERRPDGRTMRMVFLNIDRDRLEWRWEASADLRDWRPMMVIQYRRLAARAPGR